MLLNIRGYLKGLTKAFLFLSLSINKRHTVIMYAFYLLEVKSYSCSFLRRTFVNIPVIKLYSHSLTGVDSMTNPTTANANRKRVFCHVWPLNGSIRGIISHRKLWKIKIGKERFPADVSINIFFRGMRPTRNTVYKKPSPYKTARIHMPSQFLSCIFIYGVIW